MRTILPVIDAESPAAGIPDASGLGDTVQSFFFSPVDPVNGWIVGAGPVFLYPTATDDLLGAEKWGAGPAAVALRQEGPWTCGVLANHLWSYAGEDARGDVNATFLQSFLTYITATKTTFALNSESTYDPRNGFDHISNCRVSGKFRGRLRETANVRLIHETVFSFLRPNRATGALPTNEPEPNARIAGCVAGKPLALTRERKTIVIQNPSR